MVIIDEIFGQISGTISTQFMFNTYVRYVCICIHYIKDKSIISLIKGFTIYVDSGSAAASLSRPFTLIMYSSAVYALPRTGL